jgi:hypothetical protein
MTRYCIRVKGHVSRRWFHALDDATITHEVGGITAITFPAVDQAALHGVLNRIRDLHVLLYSVALLEDAAVETDGCSAAT